jgi:ATP-dependent DNA ligase
MTVPVPLNGDHRYRRIRCRQGHRRLYSVGVSRVSFIPPAVPKLRASPPTGENWSYEVKFDGFRTQLHRVGNAATIYGKNGGDLTRRFPTIVAEILALRAKSFIIDGELIAAGEHGQPDFLALLHGSRLPVCVYAFDLMELRRRDLTSTSGELSLAHCWPDPGAT